MLWLHFAIAPSTMNSELAIYNKKIEEYTKGIRDIYMDKVKGLITDDDFVAMSKDFVKEKERLQKLVQERQEKIIEIEEKKSKTVITVVNL